MSNELQVLEQNAIVAAFAKRGGTDELFDRIAQEARSHVPDVTTKKGRDAIGSLAMKISKSKTIIEKYGKEVVAEQKAQIKLIDDDRISVVKKFDELRNEILAPRDAWEQAEKDRVAKHELFVITIRDYLEICSEYNAEMYKGAIQRLESVVIDSSLEEYEEQAKLAKFETLEKLRNALAVREKYEAEQAELECLRQAEIERQQKERDEKIAREAADKARVEAEAKALADRKRAEQEKLEAEQREARLKLEKEQAELREQQLKQQAIEREKQAEIDRQNAVEAERLRIEQQQKIEDENKARLEQQRKDNIEHMRQINNDILSALLSTGLNDDQAKQVITAIAKNQVPHVSIKY